MIFRADVSNPEGPVLLPDGSWVIAEMNRGLISSISADGKDRREIAHTGRPNGIALGKDKNLWVAESRFPALLKVSMNGEVTSLSTGGADLPFLWPNDLCFGPDGSIYMTDSGILLEAMEGSKPPSAAYEQKIDGRLFRIDPQTGTCELLDRGLLFANGLAFGPGAEWLYVGETLTGNIYRYEISAGRVNGERQLFGNVMIKPPAEHGRVAGPDGMAFDVEGNLYVAVLTQGDITVLKPDGSINKRLEIDGTFPTNVAFAKQGDHKILVTEGSKNRLLLLEVPATGLTLYSGAIPEDDLITDDETKA